MTKAKQQALMDIKNDLQQNGKTLIPFRQKLNHVIGKLVYGHIQKQENLQHPFQQHTKSNTQLVAHCFFSAGRALLNDYSKYYETDTVQR